MRNLPIPSIFVCLVLGLAAVAGGQPASTPPDAAVEASRPQSLDARLAALDPSMPEGYFTLGEEVVAEASAETDFALAQRLYVLTIVLANEEPQGATLAASACVALADISRAESDRRALWSIARTLDPRYGVRDWSRSTEVAVTDDLAYLTATILGKIRAGWGTTVIADLRRPDVRNLILRYSALMTGSINQNVLPELEQWAQVWPCPECRNERIVTKRHTGQVERRLCYTCGGNPGPELTTQQLIGQLRFESFLLDSRQRSWGAQVAADLGEPLRDADLSVLPLRFGVDPALTLYRGGEWAAPTVPDDTEPVASEPAGPDAP